MKHVTEYYPIFGNKRGKVQKYNALVKNLKELKSYLMKINKSDDIDFRYTTKK